MADTPSIAVKSGFWSAVLQWSRFGINALVFLLLMRWLNLEEIGAFATAFALVRFFQAIQQSGFSDATIQQEGQDNRLWDAIFWLSVFSGLFITLLLWLIASWFGAWIGDSRSGNYLEILAVIPLLIGLSAVPEGILRKTLQIKQLALRTMISLSISGVIALMMGYYGYGGWALTLFAVLNAISAMVLGFYYCKWRPRQFINVSDSRKVLPLILIISSRSVANAANVPMIQLFVGVYFGAAAAGAFQIAHRFLTMLETLVVTPFRYVALPLFSTVQNDLDRMNKAIIKSLEIMSVLSAPFYCGLLVLAPSFLPLVVGEQNAMPAALILQGLCIGGVAIVINSVFDQSLTSVGKPSMGMYRNFALLVLTLIMCIIALNFDVVAIGVGVSLVCIVMLPFLLFYMKKEFKIQYGKLVFAIAGPYLACGLMALVLFFVDAALQPSMSAIQLLFLELLIGFVLSCLFMFVFARSSFLATFHVLYSLRLRKTG